MQIAETEFVILESIMKLASRTVLSQPLIAATVFVRKANTAFGALRIVNGKPFAEMGAAAQKRHPKPAALIAVTQTHFAGMPFANPEKHILLVLWIATPLTLWEVCAATVTANAAKQGNHVLLTAGSFFQGRFLMLTIISPMD